MGTMDLSCIKNLSVIVFGHQPARCILLAQDATTFAWKFRIVSETLSST